MPDPGTSLFKRPDANPVLTCAHLGFPTQAVLNPGATQRDGEVLLLVRIETLDGGSDLHVATSANGVDGWHVRKRPLLARGGQDGIDDRWGCEDARITWLAEHEAWYITYTASGPDGASVGLAKTRDFETIEPIAVMFPPNNKDGVLLPRKVDGRWASLHRPDAGGAEHMWASYSDDLTHWGDPVLVLETGEGPAWDAKKVGAGPPPIETDDGWLQVYHGVKQYGLALVYRVGVVLLERDAPHRIAKRYPWNVFRPEADYETTGLVPGVVFPTGLLDRGDELWMYYGAADTCIGLATVNREDLLARFDEDRPAPPHRV